MLAPPVIFASAPAPKAPPAAKAWRIVRRSMLRNVPAVLCLAGLLVFLVIRGITVYRGLPEDVITDAQAPAIARETPAAVVEVSAEVSIAATAVERRAIEFAYETLRTAGVEPTAHERPVTRRREVKSMGTAWSVRLQVRGSADGRPAWLAIAYRYWLPIGGEPKHWRTEIEGAITYTDRKLDRLLGQLPPDTEWDEL